MNSLKNLIKKISKNEWKFIIIISVIAVILISTPFIYSFIQQDNSNFYNGKHALSPGDLPVYYSYINQIKDGNYLLINQFTAEPDQFRLLNLFWLGTGLFARITNLSPIITLHIFRIIFIPILVMIVYLFLSLFIKNISLKKTLVALLFFSSGLGMWFYNFRHYENSYLKSPTDLWVSESNIFASIYHSPHFTLSWILIIFTFILFILAIQNKKLSYSVYAGLVSLVLFQYHPYHFLTIYLVAFTYCLFLYLKQKKLKIFLNFLILALISSPSILYHLYSFTDPLISARSLQNLTLTPPIIYVILGFGIFFPFAVWGLLKIFKQKKDEKYIFLIIWFLGSFLLIYLPDFQFQRRLLQGIQLPLAFLAIAPFWDQITVIYKKMAKIYLIPVLFIIILALAAPTTIYHIGRDIIFAKNQSRHFYLSTLQKNTIDYLSDRAGPENTVLCQDTFLANILPAQLPAKVFAGHLHESIDLDNKLQLKNQFFSQSLPKNESINLFEKYNIAYVISEKKLGYDFLSKTTAIGTYFIYKINQ